MPKRFTLAEAQRLLPEAGRLLQDAITQKSEFDESQQAMMAQADRITKMGGMVLDRDRALEMRGRRDRAAAELKNAIEQVQELGCVVKDLDIGLIDFPTLFRGVEVYLCWRLGEGDIEYWHGVEEGFRGRKAIDKDFIDNHEGDRPH